MPVLKKVWDREAEAYVDMFSLNAAAAVKHDPKRYSLEKPEAEKGPVEIPEDWKDLPFSKRRAIALKLGEDNNVNSERANAAIEAELAKRA